MEDRIDSTGSVGLLTNKKSMIMHFGAIPILFEFAKHLRNNPTEAEKFLWKQLSGNRLNGFRFRRQHPVLYFIADFYCHKAKLIIEVDGGYHNIPE